MSTSADMIVMGSCWLYEDGFALDTRVANKSPREKLNRMMATPRQVVLRLKAYCCQVTPRSLRSLKQQLVALPQPRSVAINTPAHRTGNKAVRKSRLSHAAW
jgi:hypothetical protein